MTYDSLLHVISIFYQHPSTVFLTYTCTMDIEPAWPARIWFFIIPMPFYTGCWRLEFDVRVPYSTQYKKSCCDQKDWILTALLVVHSIYTSCSKHFRAMLGSRPIKFIKWWSSFIHYRYLFYRKGAPPDIFSTLFTDLFSSSNKTGAFPWPSKQTHVDAQPLFVFQH